MTISSQYKQLMSLLQKKISECLVVDSEVMSSSDKDAKSSMLRSIEASAEDLGNIANSIGLKGFSRACVLLRNNFQQLSMQKTSFSPDVIALIHSWAVPLSGYYHNLGNELEETQAVGVILDFLSDPAWPSPLEAEALEDLKFVFSEPFLVDSQGQELSPVIITDAMASLVIPSDVESAIVTDFLSELSFQAEAFDCAVEQYLITEDEVQLRVAQRIAHNIKGSANVVGVRALSYLMHYVEDALGMAAKTTQIDNNLGFILQDSADCLSVIADYLNSLGPKPAGVAAIIQAVLDYVSNQSNVTVGLGVNNMSGVKNIANSKDFHLENLIAFNDPGLRSDPPIFQPELVSESLPAKEEDKPLDTGLDESVDTQEVESFDALMSGLKGEGYSDNEKLQITEKQKQDLVYLSSQAQAGNARILELIESLVSSLQTEEQAEGLIALRKMTLDQSQLGLTIQQILGDLSLFPRNALAPVQEERSSTHELSSSKGLLVTVDGQQLYVLSEALEKIVYVEPERLIETAEDCVYRLANIQEPLPVFRLKDKIFSNSKASNKACRALLVISVKEGYRSGVLIESIVSSEKLLIKPLGQFDRKIPGVVGTAVLKDESVTLVVDLQKLTIGEYS